MPQLDLLADPAAQRRRDEGASFDADALLRDGAQAGDGGEQRVERALVADAAQRRAVRGGARRGRVATKAGVRAVGVQIGAPAVAEALELGGREGQFSRLAAALHQPLREGGAVADRLRVRHRVAGEVRQQLDQAVGEGAQRALDEGLGLGGEGRRQLARHPEVRKNPRHLSRHVVRAVVGADRLRHAPGEDGAPEQKRDAGTGR